jgi:hypothetical protein
MRIWFDTEFIEDGRTIDLISIGMTREDDARLYLQNADCDLNRASDWVRKNVFPHLDTGPRAWTGKNEIARRVCAFAGDSPEFWAYYADYDWVALCQLFGTMMDLPKGWPMYCRDLKQAADLAGNPTLPKQDSTEHHALADAIWTRRAWEWLESTKALKDGLGAVAEPARRSA